MDFTQCVECKKIISMICKSCRTKTEEQYHNDCLLGMIQSSGFSNNILENLQNTAVS